MTIKFIPQGILLGTLALALSMVAILFVLPAWQTTQAQQVYFGKNRVQYEDFDWRYIESEHFDIYYYDQKNYHLAQFTAESIEAALQQLSEDFDHQIRDRIPVILYDSHGDFSQTNVVPLPESAQGIGGVTDKYKNRMTQPFMGDYIDFRRTLHHELVHAFINDMYYGGSLQSIVQNNIQLQFPLWFEEGLAEYLALGWDTNTDMYMREAVLNNFLPPLQQLNGYYAYRGGQSFWFFVEQNYGRQKVTEILQSVQRTRNVERTLVQTLGLDMEELSDRWQDFLQRRYFPEVAQREPLTTLATQITDRDDFGSYNTSPQISPQGDKLAMISNRQGLFDVLWVDPRNGEKVKTLVSGEDNPMFEELNILNPNLSWSPDGQNILLSAKSGGNYSLVIVNVNTGKKTPVVLEELDAIRSVAWSPDGQKIAFDANQGPYQDIFVLDLESKMLRNVTRDVFSDMQPAWSADSESIYFVSDRGDVTDPGRFGAGSSILADMSVYQTDLYRLSLNSLNMTPITNTRLASETQPAITQDGDVYFISDANGIPNVWVLQAEAEEAKPVTNVESGIAQISVSKDGSRLALNGLNEGFLDIFVLRNPASRIRTEPLPDNLWAQERASMSADQRVAALGYTQTLIASRTQGNVVQSKILDEVAEAVSPSDSENGNEADDSSIDFRNYVFSPVVAQDSTLKLKDDPRKFEPENKETEDGYYQPKRYHLTFSPDFSYASGGINTYYGTSALATFSFSDLFGDHRVSISSNLVLDLRNSTYSIQYGYFKQRTNYFASFFHQAQNYQTFSGELLRFRTYGFGVEAQYPLNKFQRIDYGLTAIGISRDFSSLGGLTNSDLTNETSTFLYPQVVFTGDFTVPGFITPQGGSRYTLRASGSPPLGSETPQFVSLLGDYRKYLALGRGYTMALRGSGALSYGRDSQTFFMGGVLGWLNQQWSGVDIPYDRLADTFFTQPATPVRGHKYNTIFGNKYTQINAEFRFPLFAAILPGPIPIIPLYNLTGVAFVDAGAAWGYGVDYSRYSTASGEPIVYYRNEPGLDFKVGKEQQVALDPSTGLIRQGTPQETDLVANYFEGDVLIGAGFGLRTILLGLPVRYDIGWPYERSGFGSNRIHYFSIGIDF